MRKTLMTTLLALTAGLALAHEGIELGPDKGRILEFSTNETMHGEVTEKDGKLHVALLDKDMKPVVVKEQTLVATSGTRQKPVKLDVARGETGFTLPAPEAGQWIIFRYKDGPDAKTITARLHFDTKECAPCGNPEWRCACAAE